MPNYLEIVGEFYPNSEAYLTMPGGDPTVYNDIIWMSTPIPQATLDTHVGSEGTLDIQMVEASLYGIIDKELIRYEASHGHFEPVSHLQALEDALAPVADGDIIIHNGTTFEVQPLTLLIGERFGAQIQFGSSGSNKNKFINSSITNASSVDSTFIAPSNGEVIAAAISTVSNPNTNWFLQIVINATKGGAGTYSGGTVLGANIEKPAGTLDHAIENLSGYSFSKGDRIAAYILGGTAGGGSAWSPAITIYVRYD